MVKRWAAEFDVPSDELALRVVLERVCREQGWKLRSLRPVTEDPPCPTCGSPMTYSPELQAYACSHPE